MNQLFEMCRMYFSLGNYFTIFTLILTIMHIVFLCFSANFGIAIYRVSAALRVQNSRSNQGVSKESNGCFQGVLFASAFNLFEEFSSSC